MATIDEVKNYITEKFATDLAGQEIPDDIDLLATGIVTSVSTVQLLGWAGKTYGIAINSIPINPASLKTPADIATFIETHRTIKKEETAVVH